MTDPLAVLLTIVAAGASFILLQRRAASAPSYVDKTTSPRASWGWAGDGMCMILGVEVACLFFLLTARPGMVFLLTVALGLLLLTLNRVKEKILHEPLVLVDAWLLKQIFRYPHLYFPYLPKKTIAVGAGFIVLALLALLAWEKPLPWVRTMPGTLLLLIGSIGPCLLIFLLYRSYFPKLATTLLALCPVSHDPVVDSRCNGPLTAAFMHPVLTGRMKQNKPDYLDPRSCPQASAWPKGFVRFLNSLEERPGPLPHVVLVQAETFYDVRQVLSGEARTIMADFLPAWDTMLAEGRAFPTPKSAFGAYTMRTEFTALTGLHNEDLGPWYFNPYLLASRQPLWSLARHFRSKGYTSMCIHPYAADFFNRHKVMPNLGFQEFITLENLTHLPSFGPYVSDLALANHILGILRQASQPIFCFAITMEAHGPWFKDRLSEEDREVFLPKAVRQSFGIRKQTYLCHLKRMDTMFGLLLDAARQGERPIEVFGYGDHAPALTFY